MSDEDRMTAHKIAGLIREWDEGDEDGPPELTPELRRMLAGYLVLRGVVVAGPAGVPTAISGVRRLAILALESGQAVLTPTDVGGRERTLIEAAKAVCYLCADYTDESPLEDGGHWREPLPAEVLSGTITRVFESCPAARIWDLVRAESPPDPFA